jgi:hypothetical protein
MTNTYYVVAATDFDYLLQVWEADEALLISDVGYGPRGEELQAASGEFVTKALSAVLGSGLAVRVMDLMRVESLEFSQAAARVGVVVPGRKL